MPQNNDIVWRFSGGASRVDPENSLGGASTANDIHEIEDQFTSISAAGTTDVFDTSRTTDGDDAHNDKYLMILTGPATNELFVSRIVDFVDATGRFALEQGLPDAVGVGDWYRIFSGNDLYDDVTAAECAAGVTRYRGIYAVNASGAQIDEPWAYITLLNPGPIEWTLNADKNFNSLPTIGDENTSPAVGGLYSGDRFTLTRNFNEGEWEQPSIAFGGNNPWSNTFAFGVYLEQTIPANSVGNDRVLAMLVVEGTSTAPPQQVKAGCIIALELDGFTPLITLQRDRDIRIKGGARYNALVKAQETGLTVPDADIAWSLDPLTGRGSLTVEDEPRTDANGNAGATYAAPTDPAEEGNVVTVEVRV